MPIQQTTYATPRADLGVALHEFEIEDPGFIAIEVLPVLPVNKEASTLPVITRETLLKRTDAKHANGANYNRITLESEDVAYQCEDFGLEEVLTDRDRAFYASDYDAELEVTTQIMHRLRIEQEVRVEGIVFNTSTWTGSALTTDVSGDWDAVGSDVIGHVLAAQEKVRIGTGALADTMIIGKTTANSLLSNTAIIGRISDASVKTRAAIMDAMAPILGLNRIIVGSAVYDSALEGTAFVGTNIWSDDYAMVCRLNTGPVRSGGLGRSVLWQDMGPGVVNVDQYREEQRKGDVFRVSQFLDEKIFDAAFGHLLQIDA